VREAFTLPLLFLTVALCGGLRVAPGGALTFAPPPLMALVLAVMLVAMLYRSTVLIPDALLRPDRGALANISGTAILLALFLASAQLLNALTPEAGLLALTYNVVFLVLFGNTLATRPDRSHLLAALMVVFGAAFVVKYVVLGALYAPEGGLTRRVVMALVEGVSLGGLSYQPPGPVTGYVAFATAGLYLMGLALLPPRPQPGALTVVVADELPARRAPDPADR